MSNLSKAAASKLQAIKEAAELRNAKNRAASRKSRYKTAAKLAGTPYADYVNQHFGVTIAVFESTDYELPNTRKASGSVPAKGTPEWNEYNRIATRKSKMKKVLEFVEILFPEHCTLDAFVKEFTDADDVDQFLSDDYAATHKHCYVVAGHPRVMDAINEA
tara:strand:- start:736 stop:1218 length:483 start_codon:yes stop_codon:yes gene_type:complete